VSATPSPSADLPEGRVHLPNGLRRLFPRTFQGRLTLAFLLVVALTIGLVTVLVVNRLDDYFASQQKIDLDQRTQLIEAYVVSISDTAAGPTRPVIGLDGQIDTAVIRVLAEPSVRRFIADQLGQADVMITFGRQTVDGETKKFTPIAPPITLPLAGPPQPGQTREWGVTWTDAPYGGGEPFTAYAVTVSLADPYTFRATALANVTGLLAAVALFALGLSVLVSAAMARRFTTPLRRLTEASRGLAEGDLCRCVPAAEVRAGSSELAELAVQFNAMADRLQESVEIIRHDRDRSRDFLADVSHELRTPLSALRMFNELLKEGAADDPEARTEFLDSSGQQIERLDWLAQNLLELSKLESTGLSPRRAPVDLGLVIRKAHELLTPAVQKKAQTLLVDVPNDLPTLKGNADYLERAVANLIDNASKYTPDGGQIRVRANANGQSVTVEVSDNGIGIPKDDIPRIFERFYRVDRSRSREMGGTGLGLSIVKHVAQVHGGQIDVESTPGKGSTFRLRLPVG